MTSSSLVILNDCTKGLLLIFLAILCNFLADTMNCSIQYTLYKYPFVKWFIMLCLIYFTINFTSSSNINPTWLFIYSIIILFIFILFMKQNPITFYISIVLLITIFSIHQYSIYYQKLTEEEENNHDYDRIIQRLENTVVVLEVCLILLLVIGNMLYLRKQRKEYKKKFKWFSFYFGTNPCKSIKNIKT